MAPLNGRQHRGDRFPRSVPEPEPSSRHLHAGHHRGSRQVTPRLIPRRTVPPGFDAILGITTRQRWFAFARLLDPHRRTDCPPFPQRSPPRLLTDAACGGLQPLPAKRLRRAHLHLRYSTDLKLRSPTSNLRLVRGTPDSATSTLYPALASSTSSATIRAWPRVAIFTTDPHSATVRVRRCLCPNAGLSLVKHRSGSPPRR
jgi:hypothetical protein